MPADRARLERVAQATVPGGAKVEHLGTGGFASTFKVTHPDGTATALKVIDPEVSAGDRVDRELAALKRIVHPNVVRYRAYGETLFEEETFRWFEMDFVEGAPLGKVLFDYSQRAPVEPARLLRGIVRGAAAIWEPETAHRDLSPNNILVTIEGTPVIVDLGMARHVDDETITVLPTPGTPGWMSPEQVNSSPVHGDRRSDQYVLGLLGYALLTGSAPFDAPNLMDLWIAPAKGIPRPVRAVAPGVSTVIADVVERMLALQPHRRYLQPSALVADLDHAVTALEGEAPVAVNTVAFYLEISQAKSFAENGFIGEVSPEGVIIDARVRGRIAEFCGAAGSASALAIIDPVTTYARSPVEARPSFYTQLVHGNDEPLTGFIDDRARLAWIRPLFEQYSEQADALIAPYFYAGEGELNWIDESLASARITAELAAAGDAAVEVWSALCVGKGWLANDTARDTLLSTATAQPHQTLFLLVHTAQESFAPIRDVELLRGLRDLLEVMKEAGVAVVAGRRASSGLLLLALGAAGWSTGVSANLMNSAPHPEAPSLGGGQPLDRVYVPQLLNYINTSTYAQMLDTKPDLVSITTAPGLELLAENAGLEELTTAQRVLLLRHNVSALRAQVSDLSQSPAHGRVTVMREWIKAAQDAYRELPRPRAGEDGGFLAAWSQVL